MKDTVYFSENGEQITSLLARSRIFAGQAPEAFLFGERAVESEDFYALYTALMSVFVEKELPREEWEEGETASADRELLMSITYERNMEGAPKITQKYFAYDETYAAVQVNGRTFFLVSREALMQLRERVEDAFSVF